MPITPYDIHIMTLTIAGEARGEDWDGKIGVGWTIKNRHDRPGWWSRNRDEIPDDTIAAVCADPYQFSCFNAGDPNLRYLALLPWTSLVYLECQKAAEAVLSGAAPDPTNGSCHYYKAGSPMPGWAAGKTPTRQVGCHLYFNDVQ